MSGFKPPLGTETLASRVLEILSAGRPLAYALIAPDLTIRHSSLSFESFLEHDQVPIPGARLPDALAEFVGAEDLLGEVLAGLVPAYRLERVNREGPGGQVRYLNFEVQALDPDQPEAGLLLVVEDTTQAGTLEQRLVQDRNELRLTQAQLGRAYNELQRLNHLKTLFLSMAAHDMRAPLSAILGYAELGRRLLQNGEIGQVEEFLDIITNQVDWLNRLIGDLLDLDQVEQGTLGMKRRPCNLVDLVRGIGQVMEGAARRAGLALRLDLPDASVPLVADPERLQRVLFNLVNNAIKYTPDGGQIDVRVGIEAGQAFVHVEDNGRGMTPSELERLYQLYYRSQSARESTIGGTGLGLYIVKTLVEAHEGTIEVSSQPGLGTIFTVRLPLPQSDPSTGRPLPQG